MLSAHGRVSRKFHQMPYLQQRDLLCCPFSLVLWTVGQQVYLLGMEALLLLALPVLSVLLHNLATRALKDLLMPETCDHEIKTTSYMLGITRCFDCGEVIEED